jgi:sulfur relay (sulfurtransferase) complex TusBCD TusD component (DsrE family)
MRSAVEACTACSEYRGVVDGRIDDSKGKVESISGISSSSSSRGREDSVNGDKICCVRVVIERDWFVR